MSVIFIVLFTIPFAITVGSSRTATTEQYPFFSVIKWHHDNTIVQRCLGAVISQHHVLTNRLLCDDIAPGTELTPRMLVYINHDNRTNINEHIYTVDTFYFYPRVGVWSFENDIDLMIIKIVGEIQSHYVIPIAENIMGNIASQIFMDYQHPQLTRYDVYLHNTCGLILNVYINESTQLCSVYGILNLDVSPHINRCTFNIDNNCCNFGNQGTPLIQFNRILARYELIGISVWGVNECNVENPTISTNLLNNQIKNWIYSIIT
jgi:hypothetical protein